MVARTPTRLAIRMGRSKSGCAHNRPSLAKTDACWRVLLGLLSKKSNAHSDRIMSVAFPPFCVGIVVWDADSFNLLETRPGEAIHGF